MIEPKVYMSEVLPIYCALISGRGSDQVVRGSRDHLMKEAISLARDLKQRIREENGEGE